MSELPRSDTMKALLVAELADPQAQEDEMVNMFEKVAWRYDIANILLTGGLQDYWKGQTGRDLINASGKNDFSKLLDVGTGTGSSIESLQSVADKMGVEIKQIAGVDPTNAMLEVARKKDLGSNVELINVGGENINSVVESNSVDLGISYYAVRNMHGYRLKTFENIEKVLKPGGSFAILDCMNNADPNLVFNLASIYTSKIMPVLGGLITGDKDSYKYLKESRDVFKTKEELRGELEQVGLVFHSWREFMSGICTNIIVKKPE